MSSITRVEKNHRHKRLHNPTKIYSPSSSLMPTVTHYLIYIADTLSYLIVGKSSIKTVNGKKANLIFNQKRFIGEIIIAGKFPM